MGNCCLKAQYQALVLNSLSNRNVIVFLYKFKSSSRMTVQHLYEVPFHLDQIYNKSDLLWYASVKKIQMCILGPREYLLETILRPTDSIKYVLVEFYQLKEDEEQKYKVLVVQPAWHKVLVRKQIWKSKRGDVISTFLPYEDQNLLEPQQIFDSNNENYHFNSDGQEGSCKSHEIPFIQKKFAGSNE